MKYVRIIPAKPKENKKLKVAAYCRVSTSGPELLRLSTESYEYLIQGETSASFAARVKAIIKSENKEINKYVETLVSQANQCRGPAISDWEVTRLINELQKLLDE